jgi:two-component system chemotaxis sensor kinase CheA
MTNPNMSQFLEIFLDEGRDQIVLLEKTFMDLEAGGGRQDVLQDVFRAAHTLKGSSKAMGLLAIGDLTHRMEDVLDCLRNNKIVVTSGLVDVMLRCTDALKGLLDKVTTSGTDEIEDQAEYDSLMAGLAALIADETVGAEQIEKAETVALSGNVVLRVTLSGDCALKGGRAVLVVGEAGKHGKISGTSPRSADLEEERFGLSFDIALDSDKSSEEIAKALSGMLEVESVVPVGTTTASVIERAASKDQAQSASATIRVPINRIDKLLNLVGELVTDRTRVASLCRQLNERHRGDEITGNLIDATSRIAQITGELQDEIMKTRMLPIDNVFQRMPRVVRDLAQGLGKNIRLNISGGDTEIDRSLIDALSDPLIHLLRNCVDHGIEDPEDRIKAGKPAEGLVELSARHQENNIVIQVTDDGKGISADTVRKKAVEKGHITQATADAMSDADALKLIFASGLSTAKNVSEISGRGVGMDIVKTNLERIGGRVTIESHPGSGTRFTVYLPLTLAIIQSLLVEAQSVTYAVPLAYVVETLKLGRDRIQLEKLSGHWAMVLRGETVPLVPLSSALSGYDAKASRVEDEAFVVVIRVGSAQYGLCVDRLKGELEVVIKPLGGILGNVNGVSGASVLGDGKVALIVDPAKLSATAA